MALIFQCLFKQPSREKILVSFMILTILTSLAYSEKFVDTILTPKAYWFYFFGSFLIFTFLIISLFNKVPDCIIKINLIDICILGFYSYTFARLFLTSTTSIDNHIFFSQTLLIFFYFVIRNVLKQSVNPTFLLGQIFAACMLVSIIQSLIGLVQLLSNRQYMTNGFAVVGTFGNPGPFANFLAIIFPIPVALFLFSSNKWVKRLSILTVILTCSLLIISQSRASWMAASVTLLFFIIFKYRHITVFKLFPKAQRIFIRLALLIFFLIFTIYLYYYKPDSANGCLFILARSMEMILDAPILGFGYDSFSMNYPAYQLQYFKLNTSDFSNGYLAGNITHPFNEFIKIAVEFGLPGLILFLMIFYSFFKCCISLIRTNRHSSYLLAATAMVMSMLILASFSYPLKSNSIVLVFYLMLALASYHDDNYLILFKLPKQVVNPVRLIGIFMCIRFWMLIYPRFQAEKEWKKTILQGGKVSWENTSYSYDNLYNDMKHNPLFLFNYGAQLSIHGDYKQSLKFLMEAEPYLPSTDTYCHLGNNYEAMHDYLNAELCFLRASRIIPHKFYPKYKLVHIYHKIGKTAKARKLANELVNMKVKVNSNLVEDIKMEMKKFLSAL